MVKIIGCLDNEMLAVKDNTISGYKISKPLNDMGEGVLQLKLLLGLAEDQSIHFKHKDNQGIVELLDDILKQKEENEILKKPLTTSHYVDVDYIRSKLNYNIGDNYLITNRLLCNLDEVYIAYFHILKETICCTCMDNVEYYLTSEEKRKASTLLCHGSKVFNKIIHPLTSLPTNLVIQYYFKGHVDRLKEFKKAVLSSLETIVVDIKILDLISILNYALRLYENREKHSLKITDIQLYIYQVMFTKKFEVTIHKEYEELFKTKVLGKHSSPIAEHFIFENSQTMSVKDYIHSLGY